MLIPTNLAKLRAALARDGDRQNLQHAELDTRRRLLVGVDGKVLCIVPVHLDQEDHAGPVSPEILSRADRAARANRDARVRLTYVNGEPGRAEFQPSGESMRRDSRYGADFPNWDAAVPRDPVVLQIAVDRRFLAKVAELATIGRTGSPLGPQTVLLTFRGSDKPIEWSTEHGTRGLVMPIKFEGDRFPTLESAIPIPTGSGPVPTELTGVDVDEDLDEDLDEDDEEDDSVLDAPQVGDGDDAAPPTEPSGAPPAIDFMEPDAGEEPATAEALLAALDEFDKAKDDPDTTSRQLDEKWQRVLALRDRIDKVRA